MPGWLCRGRDAGEATPIATTTVIAICVSLNGLSHVYIYIYIYQGYLFMGFALCRRPLCIKLTGDWKERQDWQHFTRRTGRIGRTDRTAKTCRI